MNKHITSPTDHKLFIMELLRGRISIFNMKVGHKIEISTHFTELPIRIHSVELPNQPFTSFCQQLEDERWYKIRPVFNQMKTDTNFYYFRDFKTIDCKIRWRQSMYNGWDNDQTVDDCYESNRVQWMASRWFWWWINRCSERSCFVNFDEGMCSALQQKTSLNADTVTRKEKTYSGFNRDTVFTFFCAET